ncbi:MAG: DUF389 domain-containing protein [Acidimicrobiales bacterium]
MIHLRIVVAPERAGRTLKLLEATASVCNLTHLPGAVRQPSGDLILCDVTSEDVSLVVADLRDLEVPVEGSIALTPIDSQISVGGVAAESSARASEAVIWEEVEARTSEMTGLSAEFLVFMVLAMLIAVAGILEATSILIVGAMIVGPDFGPVAAACVALVERRGRLIVDSLASLAVGFAFAAVVTGLIALGLRHLGVFPAGLNESTSHLPPGVSSVVGPPGVFTFFVAACAGIVGMLSLSTAKSGALIGVLVSVTTIPAAANAGLAASYARWSIVVGSAQQLGANIATLLVAGTVTLAVQRGIFVRYRRAQRGHEPARAAAGLPIRER